VTAHRRPCALAPRVALAATLAELTTMTLATHGEQLDALSDASVELLNDLAEVMMSVALALQNRDENTARAALGAPATSSVLVAPTECYVALARQCAEALRTMEYASVAAG
jgi:hypothetical protein